MTATPRTKAEIRLEPMTEADLPELVRRPVLRGQTRATFPVAALAHGSPRSPAGRRQPRGVPDLLRAPRARVAPPAARRPRAPLRAPPAQRPRLAARVRDESRPRLVGRPRRDRAVAPPGRARAQHEAAGPARRRARGRERGRPRGVGARRPRGARARVARVGRDAREDHGRHAALVCVPRPSSSSCSSLLVRERACD